MDKIKRKSWVGSIYHKFEVMCQEVDGFVTKDTVKYVENQVQTVGESMKKLYSGVVQDIRVPDDQKNGIESRNASTSEEAEIDISVGNGDATSTFKVFYKNVTREEELVDKELISSEDKISTDPCAEKDSKDIMSYSFSDDDGCFSDVSSSRIILQDDIVKEEQEMTQSISYASITQTILQDYIIREDKLAPEESNSARDEILPQTPAFASDIPPTSLNDAGSGVSMTTCNSSLSDVTCVSEMSSEPVLSPYCLENESVDVDSGVSNSCLLAEFSHLSTSSTANGTQKAECGSSIYTGLTSSSPLASADNIVAVIPALPSTHLLTDFIGCINDCCVDLPGMETIDLTDKRMLKESCVVNNKLHNTISFRPRKYKSYKELIQEAFASRKRLIKEYKQLAVLYADVDAETSQHSEFPSLHSPCSSHSTESPSNICESGWELL